MEELAVGAQVAAGAIPVDMAAVAAVAAGHSLDMEAAAVEQVVVVLSEHVDLRLVLQTCSD
jgi:hypothetical protein